MQLSCQQYLQPKQEGRKIRASYRKNRVAADLMKTNTEKLLRPKEPIRYSEREEHLETLIFDRGKRSHTRSIRSLGILEPEHCHFRSKEPIA
jgi:hypothetical protein